MLELEVNGRLCSWEIQIIFIELLNHFIWNMPLPLYRYLRYRCVRVHSAHSFSGYTQTLIEWNDCIESVDVYNAKQPQLVFIVYTSTFFWLNINIGVLFTLFDLRLDFLKIEHKILLFPNQSQYTTRLSLVWFIRCVCTHIYIKNEIESRHSQKSNEKPYGCCSANNRSPRNSFNSDPRHISTPIGRDGLRLM